MSVVERARIVRVPSEAQLQRALSALLEAPAAPPGLSRRRSPGFGAALAVGSASARRRPARRHRPSRLACRAAAARLPRPRDRPTQRPRTQGGHRTVARRTARPVASRRSTRPGSRRRRRPHRRPSPTPRSPTRTARAPPRSSRADEPRLARQPGRQVRRPQLAAEARGHRARHAAVRGARRVPGQQRVPGSGGRAPRQQARRDRRHQRPARPRPRSGTSRRSTSVACVRRTSRRPSTSPTSSPTASSRASGSRSPPSIRA